MIQPLWLALFYGLSEIVISTFLRAKNPSGADKGSLRVIWVTINFGVLAAVLASIYLPSASFAGSAALYWIGMAVYVLGLALRWFSIIYLGRFFTVNVTVTSDQKVIDTGPYRLIRHPSYTGALLAFLGLGLCFANAATMFLLFVPAAAAFLYRIGVEEAALQAGLGDVYRRYMQRTKRLVPFIY